MAYINFVCPKCSTRSMVDADAGVAVCPVCNARFVRKSPTTSSAVQGQTQPRPQQPVTQQLPVQYQQPQYQQPQYQPPQYQQPQYQPPQQTQNQQYNSYGNTQYEHTQQNTYNTHQNAPPRPQQNYTREQVYSLPPAHSTTFDESTFWGRFAKRYLQNTIAGGFVVLFLSLFVIPFLMVGYAGFYGLGIAYPIFGFNVMFALTGNLSAGGEALTGLGAGVILASIFYLAALVLLIVIFVLFIKDYRKMQFGRSVRDFVLVAVLWGCFLMIFIMALVVAGQFGSLALIGISAGTWTWIPLLFAFEPIVLILIFRFIPAQKERSQGGGYGCGRVTQSGYSTSSGAKQENGFVRGVKKFWNNKTLRYISIAAVILIVGGIILLSVLGGNKPENQLQGKWTSEESFLGYDYEIEFDGNNYKKSMSYYGYSSVYERGTYKIDGDKITFTDTDDYTETYTFRLDGKTLYIDEIRYDKKT